MQWTDHRRSVLLSSVLAAVAVESAFEGGARGVRSWLQINRRSVPPERPDRTNNMSRLMRRNMPTAELGER
jgi:hypothetical protein